MEYLKFLDQFGAQLIPPINQKDQQFKSYIGGFTSLVIYSLAFVYFIIQMIQWQTNQIIPVVSTSLEKIDQLKYNISTLTIKNGIQNLNPFDPQGQILVPLLFGIYPILANNGTFTFQNTNLSLDEGQSLYFVNCTAFWEEKQQIKCASGEQILSFYSQFNQIQLTLQLSKYDVKTKQLKSYNKSFDISIDPGLINYQQIMVQTGITQVQDGFIFAKTSNTININDASIQQQPISLKYMSNIAKKVFGTIGGISDNLQYQSVIQIKLSDQQQTNIIQYPLLGTILANVGSIVSLLMLLSKIIVFFNHIQLEKYMMQQIICFYYPQFKLIKVHENLWNKNVKFTSQDDKIQYDNENLEQIYRRSQEIAQYKINYLNIIYELSRLQFVIQSLQDRQLVIQSQDIGIRLPPLKIIYEKPKIKKSAKIDNFDEQLQIKNQQISINSENQLIQEKQNDHDKQENQNQGDENQEQKSTQVNNKSNDEQNDNKLLIDLDMQLLMIPDSNYQQSENNIDRKIITSAQQNPILFYQSNNLK